MADTTTILSRLISALTSQDPTWDVVPGTAEYKILEAVAQELAVAANNNTLQNYSFDITTKSGSQLDDFCALFGIFRSQGKRASGNATFSTASTGLTGGTLTINNATGGSFSASYNGQTASSLAYNISNGTLQTQLSSILPVRTVVNVTYSSPTYTITIVPSLPAGMLTFDTSGVTGVSGTLNTSWSPSGGATANYEIPLGTQIYAPSAATGTVPIYYQTTASSALPQYGTQVQVPIQAVLTGSNGNITAGTISALATALAGVTQVTNSALTGGSDAETDDQLRQRWQNTVFKNLSGTEDQFRALALSNPGTSRVKVLGPQEQNVEDLQIQTTLQMSAKYDGTMQPSTNFGATNTFNLYFQVETLATWTVSGSGVSSVVTFTIPSGQTSSGIYIGMNVYSFTFPISLTYGLYVSNIVVNSDGSTTVTALQLGGATQTIASNSATPTNVTFCVPVLSSGSSFDATTTIYSIQNKLNTTATGPIISDLSQLITLTPTYNSSNLSITATGGSYKITYVDSTGTSHTSSNITSGTFSTAASLKTALDLLLAYDGYKSVVTIGSASSPYTYTVDFYSVYTSYPVDISTINNNLSFNFASLSGTGAGGLWTIPTGLSGTLAQLATCNIQFSKPSTTDLSLIAGRIDSTATSGYPGTPNHVSDAGAILSDLQGSPSNYTYIYGCGIPVNTYISNLLGAGPYTGYVTSQNATIGLGGTGVQLLFTGANNPYSITSSVSNSNSLLSSITTTVSDAIYIYPQGIESLRSSLSSSSTQQTASYSTDYSYKVSSTISTTVTSVSASTYATYYQWTFTASNNFIAGQKITTTGSAVSAYNGTFTVFAANSTAFVVCGANNPGSTSTPFQATGAENSYLTLTIQNGNNYPWLYPGNIPVLTYYLVLDASRNVPSSIGIQTNYVDVIVDGSTQQLITEDVVMNATNTTNLTPGSSGVFNASNSTKWVLGDKITNPPIGDLFYIFSQQPVIQPWFGVYPQKLTLSQPGGNHTGLQAYGGPIGGSDPVVPNVTTVTTSPTMTVGNRSMYPIYYKEWLYLPEAFTSTSPVGYTTVASYSQTGNSITAADTPNNANVYQNVMFTSDIYPIYDNTINQGSTLAINGIGIRQNNHYRNITCTTNTASATILDASASNADLGKMVTDNPSGTTYIKDSTRVISVVPGVSFTMSKTGASSSGSAAVRIADFVNTPTISTGDLIFGLQYYVDSDVVAIDNLIQQQRLVGVSTLTHLANTNYLLINLVAVLSSSADIASVNTSLNTQFSNYLNSLPFGEPVQVSSLIRIAISTSGVLNARIANDNDNSAYYGIQEVTPYTYYDSIQEISQGGASAVDFRDILIKQTYTGDVILGSDNLPVLFSTNLYNRSQSDF